MAGYTILSVAGYAPDFVRHSALEGWALPPDVKIEATGQILERLEKGCRRRTGRGIARSDPGGGASDLAVRGRAQSRDAVAGAARCHHRGGRLPPRRGPRASAAGGDCSRWVTAGERRLVGAAAFARLRAAQAAVSRRVAVTKRFCCAVLMLAARRLRDATTAGACAAAAQNRHRWPHLAAAIDADAKRSDHEPDSKTRC